MYPVHRRSLAYIKAAVSSSSKFEQSDGINGILVDREGVECAKLHALLGQLESRNCYEGDDTFDAFGTNLQSHYAAFFFFCLWSPVFFFFFESHVDQTVDRLGTRVEFTETEDLSKKSAWRRQRNFVTVEAFENVSTKRVACPPAWSPDSRWSEMIRAPEKTATPSQRCK